MRHELQLAIACGYTVAVFAVGFLRGWYTCRKEWAGLMTVLLPYEKRMLRERLRGSQSKGRQ